MEQKYQSYDFDDDSIDKFCRELNNSSEALEYLYWLKMILASKMLWELEGINEAHYKKSNEHFTHPEYIVKFIDEKLDKKIDYYKLKYEHEKTTQQEPEKIVKPEQPKKFPDPAENISLQRATINEPTDNDSLDEQYVFRKEGEIWKITYNGESYSFRDIKGLNHICFLLKHKNEPISVHDLLVNSGMHEIDVSKSESVGALDAEELSNKGIRLSNSPNKGVDIFDDKYLESLDKKIQGLLIKYDTSQLEKDEEKMEEILEKIKSYRKTQTNIHGKSRKVGSDDDRIRISIANDFIFKQRFSYTLSFGFLFLQLFGIIVISFGLIATLYKL